MSAPDPSHIASEFARAIEEWKDADPGTYFAEDELREPEERVDPQTGYLE